MCRCNDRLRDIVASIDAPGTKTYWFLNLLNYLELILTSIFISNKGYARSDNEEKFLTMELIFRTIILLMRVSSCRTRHQSGTGCLSFSKVVVMIVPITNLSIYLACWRGTFDNPYDWIILFNLVYSGSSWIVFFLLFIVLATHMSHVAYENSENDDDATSVSAITVDQLPPEAKMAMIRNLSEYTYDKIPLEEERRKCAICLAEFSLGEMIKLLPCTHMFHSGCIEPWLSEYRMNCPTCRFNLGGQFTTWPPVIGEQVV